jgi:hypothetical protein
LKQQMKHIKKALSYSIVGSIGLTVVASLNGCGDQGNAPQQGSGFSNLQDAGLEQSQFLVIEQTGSNPDTYKVVEKHPTTGPTRAILRDLDGNEHFLPEEELRKLAEEEAAKVEAGTSNLTQEQGMSSGGLSLGEVLLASAAGALVGGMLANRLMGNRNFQGAQQRYGGGRPTSSISQPYNKQAAASNSKPRSGYFGGSKSGTSSSRSSYGSFGG